MSVRDDLARHRRSPPRPPAWPRCGAPDTGAPTEVGARGRAASRTDLPLHVSAMHPSVHAEHPGKCPICGMDLVPVTKAEAKSGVVRVDPQRLQKIGVRFADVERAPLVRTVRALGRVTWDETKLVDVTLKSAASCAICARMRSARGSPGATRSSRCTARSSTRRRPSTSWRCAAERPLARCAARAPDCGSGTWPIATSRRSSSAATPFEALPVRSPACGVLVEKNVVEGAAFEPGARLFRIAPLERVWVEAEVYASDLPLVAVGQTATISAAVPARPRARGARRLPAARRSRARRAPRASGWSSATATSRCGPRCSSTWRCTPICGERLSCPPPR